VQSCMNNGHNSCDSGIRVLNYCHSWDKFVNTHSSHSRQCLSNVILMTTAKFKGVNGQSAMNDGSV